MAHFTNPLATPSQLYHQTSFSSLPRDLLEVVFLSTQCLTQAAGLLLDLPQSVTAQANVLLARYWLVDSPMAYEFTDASAAALLIASKVGPLSFTLKDMANVYGYLLSKESNFLRPGYEATNDAKAYYQSDADVHAFHTRLLAMEARMLYALGFDAQVALPHHLAVTYIQTLELVGVTKREAAMRAFHYLNTALLSPQMLYLTHQPHALATAAIYNAAKDLGAKTPGCEWWEVFDVDREELGFLVVGMRSVQTLLVQRKEEMPHLLEGVVTRRMIEEEMGKRGLAVADASEVVDEESAVMRRMDEQAGVN
ncbi:cyclin-like protein [Stachybotrys elegans]|uniref:Cyclin-like protein n=1 Tax=Stachybotrys elegans TaxID=80388 RepID=A0A8K0WW68_9HYPO|nr:cyclin-like protein [Stachybotrys elegans]